MTHEAVVLTVNEGNSPSKGTRKASRTEAVLTIFVFNELWNCSGPTGLA